MTLPDWIALEDPAGWGRRGLMDAVPVFEQKKREYFFFFFFGGRKKKKNK